MFKFEKQRLIGFLDKAQFPADKDSLIHQAEKANLPHQLVLLMQRLDPRSYESPHDVEQSMLAHRA